MKSLLYKSLIFLFIAPFVSCNFLEVETVGRTTMPNFFSDVDGLKAGLTGSYSKMYAYYSSEFYKYPEVAGNMIDLNIIGSEVDMIDQYNFTSNPEQEIGAVGYIWRKILEALANVNNVIEYAPPLKEIYPNEIKAIENVEAQAYFLRALCHFDLFRSYAQPFNYTTDASHPGVPVLTMTPGPDDLPSRESAKRVFDQIINDLEQAEKLFDNEPMKDAYHVSVNAVWGLLGRVYLYKEDWDNAIHYSSKIIDDMPLAYDNDYLAMYNSLTAGKEAVLRFNGTLKSKSLGTFFSSDDALAVASDTLLSLFDDPDDIRHQLFLANKGGKKNISAKYRIKIDYTTEQERYDPFVFRVSEAYLNRAEAYLNKDNLSNAEKDIQSIIGRALNKSGSDVFVEYSGKEELRTLIKKERAKELSFEAHGFFDIVRQKDDLVRGITSNSTVKHLPYPNDLFVLPLPQTELNANTNMQGNPTVND